MAINVGYEILLDSTLGADKWSEIIARVITALGRNTRTFTTPASAYSAGSGSTNQATITVGGATTDRAIRVVMDSAVVGTDVVPEILRKIVQALESETLTIAHATSYAAGSRAYQILITLT